MPAPLKRLQRFAWAAMVATVLAMPAAHADWSNFGTVSMTDATHPKLTNGYGCSTDGRDIICDNANSAVSFGTGGLINYGGLTVMGGISASAVSSTYVSATVLQINPSTMPCSTGLNGTIRYSSVSNTLEVCAGTAWSTLSSNTAPGNVSGNGSATAVAFWNGPNSLTYDSKLYWDNTGKRLGIGLTTPSSTLYVAGGAGASGGIVLGDTSGNDRFSIYQYGSLSAVMQLNKFGGLFIADNIGTRFAGFQANGRGLTVGSGFVDLAAPTNGLVVEGKAGIGTGSPTATLQVSGTFTVSNSTQGATSPSLYVMSNGNIGIGTTSPKVGLHVIKDDGDGYAAWFQRNQSSAGVGIGSYGNGSRIQGLSNDGAYAADLNLNPSGGNVIIGFGTPGSSLTIVGEAQVGNSGVACVTATNAGAIRYSAGTLYYCNASNTWTALSTGGGTLTGAGSATAIAFWNGANSLTYESATTSGLYWDVNNKWLGVGKNVPANTVDVSGSIRTSQYVITPDIYTTRLFDLSDGLYAQIVFGGANKSIVFSTSATEAMRITSAGKVGIGVATPQATLQVSGTFTVSSTATASSPSLYIGANGGVSIGSTTNIWTNNGTGLYVTRYTGRWGLMIAGDGNAQADMLFKSNYNQPDQKVVQLVNGSDTFEIRLVTDAALAGKSLFNANLTTGAVGISNTTPIAKLDVNGTISASDAIQVGQSNLSCITQISGSIRFNTTSNTLQVCTNVGWVSLASGTTGGAGTLTGSGSATAVAFWNGPNSLTYESATTSGLYWDHTNGRLGVGTNSPTYDVTVNVSRTSDAGFSATNSSSDANASASVGATSDVASYAVMARSSGLTTVNSTGRAAGISLFTNVGATGGLTLAARNAAGRMYFYTGGSNFERMRLDEFGNLGIGTQSPTATLQVSGSMVVSQTGQNTAAAASLLVDDRGVSVSSIVHINGSAFTPIGAGGNAILSGTTAVSTSSAGSITMFAGGSPRVFVDVYGLTVSATRLWGSSVYGSDNFWLALNGTANAAARLAIGLEPANTAGTMKAIHFWTNSAERMRIESTGDVLFGSAGYDWTSNGITIQGQSTGGLSAGLNSGAYWTLNRKDVNGTVIAFGRNGTQVGSISVFGSSTSYDTTSDRRLKENITDTREGLQKLMQLPVRDFAFRADPSHTIVTGFIAQELDKVFPEAVTTNGDNGETPLKDKAKPWSVDYGRVTPLIVKAMQDLKHLFDADHDDIAKIKADNGELRRELNAANDNIKDLQMAVDRLQKASGR